MGVSSDLVISLTSSLISGGGEITFWRSPCEDDVIISSTRLDSALGDGVIIGSGFFRLLSNLGASVFLLSWTLSGACVGCSCCCGVFSLCCCVVMVTVDCGCCGDDVSCSMGCGDIAVGEDFPTVELSSMDDSTIDNSARKNRRH